MRTDALCHTLSAGLPGKLYFAGGMAMWIGFALCLCMAGLLFLYLLYKAIRNQQREEALASLFKALVSLFAGVLATGSSHELIGAFGVFCIILSPWFIIHTKAVALGKSRRAMSAFLLAFMVFIAWIALTECYVWYA